MIPFFVGFLACLSAFFRSRYNLGIEILALRQQCESCGIRVGCEVFGFLIVLLTHFSLARVSDCSDG
jgi:hypothetical protein